MLVFLVASLAGAQPSEAYTVRTATEVACNKRLTETANAGSTGMRKLGELPPAQAMFAVNLSVDGCPMAVLIRPDDQGRRLIPLPYSGRVLLPARERLQPQRRLERD